MNSEWVSRELLPLLKVQEESEVTAHIAGNQEVFVSPFAQPSGN